MAKPEHHLSVAQAQEMYKDLGYDVQNELGWGTFKQVFLVSTSQGQYALKVFHYEDSSDKSNLEKRSHREAKTMGDIDSLYIAQVLDFNLGGMNHLPYMVEEYIAGKSLQDKLIEIEYKPSLEDIFHWLDNCFQALQKCAEQKIVHRDVKPSNILLRANGDAVLTDFGLARPLDDLTITQSGILIGTIPYAPPEFIIYNKQKLDETSDLFSLGIMMYQMLTTGQHPYIKTMNDRMAAATEMLHSDALSPNEIDREIDPDLSKHTMRLIERKRGLRYPNVKTAYKRFKKIQNELLG